MQSFSFLFRLMLLWALCRASLSQQVHHLVVSRVADGTANAVNCFPVAAANDQCNLRSAWEACTNLPSTDSCNIHLPSGANISFANGPLILNPGADIHVWGNNATVQLSDPYREELIVKESYVTLPDLNSTHPTHADQCIEACPNDAFRFAGCEGAIDGAPVFEVYIDNEGEDDWIATQRSCDRAFPYIIYAFTGESCTSALCFSVSCDQEKDTCSASVNIYKGIEPLTPPRFITYVAGVTSAVPHLNLSNLTLSSFGSSLVDGGALHLDGPVRASFESVTFHRNTGSNGAAVYISGNNMGTTFAHCDFVECLGYGLGAVSFFEDNRDIVISDSNFIGCHAAEGGGLYFGSNNDLIQVYNTSFVGCTARDDGGAVRLDNGNSDLSIINCHFVDCISGSGGGLSAEEHNSNMIVNSTLFERCQCNYQGAGIFIDNHNGISVANSVFLNCTSGSYGGGFFADSNNHYITIADVEFRGCDAYDGGGLYLESSNLYAQITEALFEDCRADASAGGMYLTGENNHMHIEDTVFHRCSALENGGAIYSRGSTDLQFLRVELTNNTAADGGGLYLGASNDGVTLTECSFFGNYAEDSGGAIYSSPTTNSLTVAGCQLQRNRAELNGGALSVEGGNHNLLITDTTSAAHTVIFEGNSYVGARIFNDSSAVAFILQLDFSTKLGPGGYADLEVPFDNEEGYQFHIYEYGDPLPGIDAPSLVIPPTLVAYLNPGGDGLPTDAAYKFKIRLIAVPINPGIPTVFANNHAGDRGGAIYMSSAVEFATMLNTRFERNSADAGGALYLRNAMTGFTAEFCVFTENKATSDGGALAVSSATFGMILKDCEFSKNAAVQNGGALSFVTNNGKDGRFVSSKDDVYFSNNAVVVDNCLFTSNAADLGGAIHADKKNEFIIQDCMLRDNTARVSGGGLLLSTQNTISLVNVTLFNNVAADSGGGIASLMGNSLNVSTSTWVNNTAGVMGGGMYLASDTQTTSHGTFVFSGNAAGEVGGAIASSFAPFWELDADASAYIIDNSAQRGSALYFRGMPKASTATATTQDLLSGHSFDGNVASVGGTVYWIRDSTMSEDPFVSLSASVDSRILSSTPSIFIGSSNESVATWGSNTAPYGEMFATQAVQVLGPQEYTATVYGAALSPPLSFTLYDFYNQVVPVNGRSSVIVSIIGAASKQCKGRFPFLTGAGAEVALQNGVAEFDGLVIQCSPEGSITLNFEARLADLVEITDGSLSSYFISNRTEMTFRSCKAGEFIKDGQCTTCPIGTFSLESTVTEATACHDGTIETGIKICYADQIIAKKGYWRRYPTSVSVLRCFNKAGACQGGNTTGDSLCLEGHEGPLCEVCSDGYYRDGPLCTSCENQGNIRPVTAFYLAIAGCVASVLAFFFYSNCLDSAGNAAIEIKPESQDSQAGLASVPASVGTHGTKLPLHARMKLWIQKEFASLKVKAKILITTYQIVSSIPDTTAVIFPAAFAKFLDAFDVFNLNVVSTVPLECTRSYTFVDKLVFTTLFPIALALLLVLFFMCEVVVQVRTPFKLNGDKRKSKLLVELKDKYLTYFFFLTYFVLPSVSTTIFHTFLCTNVDPSGEDSDTSDYYLTADMSISCTSDYYHRGLAYAIAMLLVYVVGIPLMYFMLLYNNREELMTRDEAATTIDVSTQTEPGGTGTIEVLEPQPEVSTCVPMDGEHSDKGNLSNGELLQVKDCERKPVTFKPAKLPEPKVLSARAQRLSFLWDAYEPKFWYWEVVETTRRLMLTAVLSVCGAGTSAQSIFAILLALMYIKLYGFFNPYVERKDDFLAETGQFQIFFSFLGALIYQKSLLGSSWNLAVSVALILINTTVSLIFTYYEVGGLVEQVQEYLRGSEDAPKPPALVLEKPSQKIATPQRIVPYNDTADS